MWPTQTIDEFLLFRPYRYPEGNWDPPDLRYEDVWIPVEDGTQLHGWFFPCERPRAVLLYCHGNEGNITYRADFAACLQSQFKIAVLLFDYRGYGRSDGIPTIAGLLLDSRAARARLAELADVPESEIVLLGESLGGAYAVQLAAESVARGLILQSTFSNLRDLADIHYPSLAWLVSRDKLNSIDEIGRCHCPLLQSHGTVDQVVPYEEGRRLFAAAHEPKTFLEIPGADHNGWVTVDYYRQIDQFVKRLPATNRQQIREKTAWSAPESRVS